MKLKKTIGAGLMLALAISTVPFSTVRAKESEMSYTQAGAFLAVYSSALALYAGYLIAKQCSPTKTLFTLSPEGLTTDRDEEIPWGNICKVKKRIYTDSNDVEHHSLILTVDDDGVELLLKPRSFFAVLAHSSTMKDANKVVITADSEDMLDDLETVVEAFRFTSHLSDSDSITLYEEKPGWVLPAVTGAGAVLCACISA